MAFVTAVIRRRRRILMAQTPTEHALDRGLRLPGGRIEYSAERLMHQFEMRRPVPDAPTVCSSAAKDLVALVIYPTHAMQFTARETTPEQIGCKRGWCS
jgi:hypothetical protein